MEPIVTPEVLQQQLHPITSLYQECQKQEPWRDGQENIASIHVNGVFVASGSSNQIMDIAELKATKQALLELSKSMPTNIRRSDFSFELNKSFEIKLAKKKLHEVCQKKRWAGPSYRYELLYHEQRRIYIYIYIYIYIMCTLNYLMTSLLVLGMFITHAKTTSIGECKPPSCYFSI